MEADVAVGATLIVGAKRHTLVSKQMLMRMKPGSVFVYVGMDQVCGGTLWWCVAGWHRQSVSHQQNWKVLGTCCTSCMHGAHTLSVSNLLSRAYLALCLLLQGGVTEVTRPTIHDDPVFKVCMHRSSTPALTRHCLCASLSTNALCKQAIRACNPHVHVDTYSY